MNLLVNPVSMVQDNYTPPPLGLLYLAAMDSETEILDLALNKVRTRTSADYNYGLLKGYIEQTKPRVVGVPVFTMGRHDSFECLRIAKEAGCVTVAGGPHVTIMAKTSLKSQMANYPWVDHWVAGDGEYAWRDICRLAAGTPPLTKGDVFTRADLDLASQIALKANIGPRNSLIWNKHIENLDDLPLPAWERININDYPARGWGVHRGNDLGALPRVSIVLGRGCAGRCGFCSAFWVSGRPRAHGSDYIAAHMQRLWDLGARHLVLQDDCLTCDREAAMVLCDILDRYNFSWFATTRVDRVDDELVGRMAAAGCYNISFGIEHGSKRILNRMHKDLDLSRAFEAREACRKHGVKFTALMMDGYPYGDEESAREDREFRVKLQPDEWGSLGHTAVFPGTALYQACKKAGLIDDDFWLGPEPYYIYHGGLS